MSITCKEIKGEKRYQASVYYRDDFDQLHRKTSKWFIDRKDAVKAEKELKAVKEDSAADLTFEKLCLEYIEYTKERNTPKTSADKVQILYNYMEPILKMNPNRITVKTVKAVFEQSKIQKLSVSRKNRIRGVLKGALDYGGFVYNMDKNPVNSFPTFKKNGVKKPYITYTAKELVEALRVIDEDHHEHRNALVFLFFTGTRLNECLSLTFNDFLENCTKVRIWRQWVKGKWVQLKNNKSQRTIELPLAAQQVFKEQLEKYKKDPEFDSSWFIFGGRKHFPPNTLRRVYKKAQKKAQLPESRLHDLRHSHASILLKHISKEEDVLKVSKRLGHSNVSTTLEIYAHILDNSEEEFMNVFNSFDIK